MTFGIDFDGVKVTVDLHHNDSVRDVIKKALATIFPPGASPAVDGCAAFLDGRRVELGEMAADLGNRGEHLLTVTLPF